MYRSVKRAPTSNAVLSTIANWFSKQFSFKVKMVATLVCPTSCGFARVAALEIVREASKTFRRENGEGTAKFRARSMQECFKRYNEVFKERSEEFAIDFLKFQKKMPALRDLFSSWNPRKKAEKEKYLETFAIQNWEKMAPTLKSEHSFANCKGCYHHYPQIQALLPGLWEWQRRIHFLLLAKRRRSSHARQGKPNKLRGLCMIK